MGVAQRNPAGGPHTVRGIKRYLPLVWWIALIIALYSIIGLSNGSVGVKACPDSTSGPDPAGAKLTIRYFGNPFCVYCWMEDPIMHRLAERHHDVLRYEHYDNRYCSEVASAYGISAVPGFVFNLTNGQTISHVGYLKESYLSQVVCEATGSCDGAPTMDAQAPSAQTSAVNPP